MILFKKKHLEEIKKIKKEYEEKILKEKRKIEIVKNETKRLQIIGRETKRLQIETDKQRKEISLLKVELEQKEELNDNLEELLSETIELPEELESLKIENKNLVERVEELKDYLDEVSPEIIKKYERQLVIARADILRLKTNKIELPNKIENLKIENKNLKERIEELNDYLDEVLLETEEKYRKKLSLANISILTLENNNLRLKETAEKLEVKNRILTKKVKELDKLLCKVKPKTSEINRNELIVEESKILKIEELKLTEKNKELLKEENYLYTLNSDINTVIDFIIKNEISITDLNFEEFLEVIKEKGIEFRTNKKNIFSIFKEYKKYFYFETRTKVFFKPIIALYLYEKEIRNLKDLKIKLRKIFNVQDINEKELEVFFKQYSSFFLLDEESIIILRPLENFINKIRSNYLIKIENKRINLKKYIGREIGGLSKEMNVPIEDLILEINKNPKLFILDGEIKESNTLKLDEKLSKIVSLIYILDEKKVNRIKNKELERILIKMLSREPLLDIQDIYKPFELYMENILINQIEEVLKKSKYFKKVGYNKYSLNSSNQNYKEFKGDLYEELTDFVSSLSKNEKIVLELRLLKEETLQKTGEAIGLTRSRVGQISRDIENKLNLSFNSGYQPYGDIIEYILNKEGIISKSNLLKKLDLYGFFKGLEIDNLIKLHNLTYKKKNVIYDLYGQYFGFLDENMIEKKMKPYINKVIHLKELYKVFSKLNINSKEFINKFISVNKNLIFYKENIKFLDKTSQKYDKLQMLLEIERRKLSLSEITELYNRNFNENKMEKSISGILYNCEAVQRNSIGEYKIKSI